MSFMMQLMTNVAQTCVCCHLYLRVLLLAHVCVVTRTRMCTYHLRV